jgi:predicted Zn-dependent peptidase
MSLLDEGTTSRTREQIVEELGSLGATLRSGGGAEQSFVSLSALKPALQRSLELYADVVMHPAFAPKELERLRAQSIAGLAQARQDPSRIAGRLLPSLIYGTQSPYGQLTTEASLRSIGRPDVAAFHERWFHPGNATLIVAGDTSLAEIRSAIEAAFASWKPAPVPGTVAPSSQPASRPTVYLVDKPGAAQSVVQAALLAPPRAEGDEIARAAFNTAFGGSFTSRLNMKLREEKGWAYGARSRLGGGKGPRIFSAGASVQADKTAESMQEIAALLKGAASDRKIDANELRAAKDTMTLGLSSDWSTSDGITQYLADEVSNALPDDYYADYPRSVGAVGLEAANAAGGSLISGRAVTWLVVGDRSKIEARIRALGLGDVRVVDADGKPVP